MNSDRVDNWARDLHLSPMEKKVFRFLAFHGEATREQLVDLICDNREDGGPDNPMVIVRVVICNLRRKIKARASIPRKTLYELDIHGL